jgi:hypothetical protein
MHGLQNVYFTTLCTEAGFVTVIVLYVFARAGSAGTRIMYVFTSAGSAGTVTTGVFEITGPEKHKGCARGARAQCVC